jgi:hypothetical protein
MIKAIKSKARTAYDALRVAWFSLKGFIDFKRKQPQIEELTDRMERCPECEPGIPCEYHFEQLAQIMEE